MTKDSKRCEVVIVNLSNPNFFDSAIKKLYDWQVVAKAQSDAENFSLRFSTAFDRNLMGESKEKS